MPNPRLASRYAKSLIDLAIELDQLEAVFKDMTLLSNSCSQSKELVSFLKSPIISNEKKVKIFQVLFQERLSDLSNRFSVLLIKKGREGHLSEIAQAAIRQYRVIKNIRQVRITTAVQLEEGLKSEIIEKVKQEIPDQKIELLAKVKKELIGGFVLETENTIFDASISRDLHDIKKQFNKNIYMSDL